MSTLDVTSEKILDLDRLSAKLDELRAQGKRVVLSHGVFDLLHPGHIRHLNAAKTQGDVLVVSLTADAYVEKGPGRPIFNQTLRAETVAAMGVVDFVTLIHDSSAVPSICKVKPQVYAKGPEYRGLAEDATGDLAEEEKALHDVGGEFFFTSNDIVFSSTHLINKYAGVFTERQREFLQDIKDRYKSDRYIIEMLQRLEQLSVLVIGDVIIDEYVYCEPLGQSLKQNLVVHQYLREERFCGGAVAVANQVAEFCKNVHLVAVFGQANSFEPYVRSQLRKNVTMDTFIRDDAPTVVKRRYLYSKAEQKVFEICHIRDHDLPQRLETDIATRLGECASEYDLVMVCDYGHGVVTHRVAGEAKRSARFLAVNAQTNSANMGYNLITRKYSGLNFASVDEAEARLALQDKHGKIEVLGPKLLHRLDTDRLIITRGQSGSTAFLRNGEIYSSPAFAMSIVDRVGAGDAFYAVTSPCFSLGMSPDLVSFIGNLVGALAVQIVGNRETVAPRDLYRLITSVLK